MLLIFLNVDAHFDLLASTEFDILKSVYLLLRAHGMQCASDGIFTFLDTNLLQYSSIQ